MGILHPHESGIGVCFGEAVPARKQLAVCLVVSLAGNEVLRQLAQVFFQASPLLFLGVLSLNGIAFDGSVQFADFLFEDGDELLEVRQESSSAWSISMHVSTIGWISSEKYCFAFTLSAPACRSTAFFQTKAYLFALASILVPSMYSSFRVIICSIFSLTVKSANNSGKTFCRKRRNGTG